MNIIEEAEKIAQQQWKASKVLLPFNPQAFIESLMEAMEESICPHPYIMWFIPHRGPRLFNPCCGLCGEIIKP